MPGVSEWEKARRWGQEHGDLVFVKNLVRPYIFINSYDAAVELFEKRGNNYSSRPQNTLIELEGWSQLPSQMAYGDEHRKSRQFLNRFFGPSSVTDFCELQTKVAHKLLFGLLTEPDRFEDFTRRSAGETIMMAAYGYEVSNEKDPYIALADRGVRSLSEAKGFSLVNLLPWSNLNDERLLLVRYLPEWVPGTGFHRLIKEGYKLSHAMVFEPYEATKKSMSDGTYISSVTSKLIEVNSTEDGNIADEPTIAKSAAIAYAAGADTTVSTLNTFILAMLLYPETQRRGQEELDRVIGKDILPTMEDKTNLPYINALCNEALRWQTVAPLGLAHCPTKDDVYNGYFIPAGITIYANIWAMQRDPLEYPEPEKFIPERWMPSDGKRTPLDVYKTQFGFGRRTCPGKHFAANSIFIDIASILAAFNIEMASDENGAQIIPVVDYVEGFVRHPKPFKCKITPRSDKITSTIKQAVEAIL
ncbi:hypothetical protein EW145_g3633 [Phellinidium pouzarii]|uniref:Cytochrome P450 n=1 Tax=Phellinidium pouzarii TaxID=167371 RepID=A0A4S4L6Q7_9AGAM|nr:hypothetical protein EW145_g3633 [Phellinidium pouzarii]